MKPFRLIRLAALPAVLLTLTLLAAPALSQKPKAKKPAPSLKTAEELLKSEPRPQRVALPPSQLPLQLIDGERIAFVGNSTAERMNLFGNFETMLHLRFPGKHLVVRNFARPADEVGIRQRSNDYTKLDDPLHAFGPDTFFCFFGFNESFAGKAGVEKYQQDYERFLEEYTKKYPRDDAGSKPRFVLVSPIAFEPTGTKMLPEGTQENANLKLYAEATRAVAQKLGIAFVDLFTPTHELFTAKPGMQFTINGAHANEVGDKALATALDEALFGKPIVIQDTEKYEKLRAAVNDKSWVHRQDYRMVNGWYVYGGRRTFDTETFPREYLKIRNMAEVRDQYVWDIAQGKAVPPQPDDSDTGELFTPPTRFGEPRQKYSENAEGGPKILPPSEFIATATVHPGTELKLFADEKRFPEIAKPVQMNFDNKGRLWLSCMPSYPQWQPGHPPANDKLVILEDTDGDGVADKSTVFYDKLHCPTGFEFFNGGVIVTDQPRMLFLKDTNGDDKADLVVHLLDGWATDDTHHSAGAFEWSPGGKLHILEGIATSTTLETPWGPHRSYGTGGCYVLDPRTFRVTQFALPGMYNMWCYVYDGWGQGIVGDGTTANQTWDVPLSGAQFRGRKGLNFILPGGVRPNVGNEWLVSRNLPDDLQRQFTYACVINLNGLTRYEIHDDGAGYMGKRQSDLVKSPDKHFRPADPQIGPDGALYFADWANPLIGHMQYSQRDPNRDHVSGRVYRLVGKGRPLVKPVTQFGKSVAEICEQFREYEWRTRYRARRELHNRPAEEVLPAVAAWVRGLNPADPEFDRLRCEALWVQQGHHAVDKALLSAVLAAKAFEARAAATHIVAEERDLMPDALAMLTTMSRDAHPRVRTEAVRGLSFFPTTDAMNAVLAVAKLPMDYWTRYTVEHALGANENIWRASYLSGAATKDNPEGAKILGGLIASSKTGAAAIPHLRVLLSQEPQSAEQKNKAMTALAIMKGNPSNGRAVFIRSCTACHKVGNGEGQEYGPNLHQVATRLKTPIKIVESIIDPNAEIDMKYLSTKIDTLDGKSVVGLVISEDNKNVVIFDGKEKKTILKDDIDTRTQLKQSSMPEGLAGAMAPAEFVDLIAYLATLK
ncbi:MAG: HEAT repeat domain-containing protein [Bacteroidales bacterium]|nr:HEAT repeat domain-containing protein [Bacteroidales bacterium]